METNLKERGIIRDCGLQLDENGAVRHVATCCDCGQEFLVAPRHGSRDLPAYYSDTRLLVHKCPSCAPKCIYILIFMFRDKTYTIRVSASELVVARDTCIRRLSADSGATNPIMVNAFRLTDPMSYQLDDIFECYVRNGNCDFSYIDYTAR